MWPFSGHQELKSQDSSINHEKSLIISEWYILSEILDFKEWCHMSDEDCS